MTNTCIVGIRTLLITLLLNARLRRPSQKKLYDGLMKLIVDISPTTKELLFGITPTSKETKIINKFIYTTLSMRHTYIKTKSIVRAFICANSSINLLSTMLKISIKVIPPK